MNEESLLSRSLLTKKGPPVKGIFVVNKEFQRPFLIDFSWNCVTINSII
jgi:hypothetical protein